jgi:hypothetical protein
VTAGRIEVFVNGRKVSIYAGMQVQHALIACDPALYSAAREGLLRIEDENGFRTGLEGAVHHGSKIFTRPVRDA